MQQDELFTVAVFSSSTGAVVRRQLEASSAAAVRPGEQAPAGTPGRFGGPGDKARAVRGTHSSSARRVTGDELAGLEPCASARPRSPRRALDGGGAGAGVAGLGHSRRSRSKEEDQYRNTGRSALRMTAMTLHRTGITRAQFLRAARAAIGAACRSRRAANRSPRRMNTRPIHSSREALRCSAAAPTSASDRRGAARLRPAAGGAAALLAAGGKVLSTLADVRRAEEPPASCAPRRQARRGLLAPRSGPRARAPASGRWRSRCASCAASAST